MPERRRASPEEVELGGAYMAFEGHDLPDGPGGAASVRPLPTGTVTLLLADQEDSSRAWEHDERAMAATIERLYACIDREVERHNGVRPVEQGEGDSFVAAFSRASEATACALAIQLATREPGWPAGGEPRLRMALHTGEVELRDPGNYMGPTINRCGRLRSLAVGGQILVSRTTADLLLDTLPPRASLLDLGPHILRGFEREEVIFQLCHPDLARDFPLLPLEDAAPRVLPAAAPPVPLTRTIGREHEIEAVAAMLRQGVRLLTLTGPGGVGKTRLSLEVARALEGQFRHGVHFFSLASIEDPAELLPTLARRSGIAIEGREHILDTIVEHLRTRRALLVLDNFEHLTAAAPHLSAILDRCAAVQALVTSRHVLRVRDEQAYEVRPLSTPVDPGSGVTAEDVARSPAVQLLLERASQANVPMTVTEANADALAELCRRLDGLPLAIELAAARIRLLPPAAMLSRLDQRLDVLTAGSVDAAARHRTLRAAMDWSHDLMSDAERAVFARLSVFAGGCTLEAADRVCRRPEEPDILDAVSSLLEHSLLVADSDEATDPRVRMLENVRVYAWERLAERGEAEEFQRRHMDWVRDLLDQAMPRLCGTGQRAWADRLSSERENLRAAVRRAIETRDDRYLAHVVLASFPFLSMRDGLSELCEWIDQGMDLMASAPPDVRATHQLAGTLCALARGDIACARSLVPESGALAAPVGSLEDGLLLWTHGVLADADGDRERAEAALTRARGLFTCLGNDWAVAYTESTLGDIHLRAAEYSFAAAHHERALGIGKRLTNLPLTGRSLSRLALGALASGDTRAAIRHIEDAAAAYRTAGHRRGLVFCIDAGAIAAARSGYPSLAATALGAVWATRERLETGLWTMVRPMLEEAELRLQGELGEVAYAAAMRKGAASDVDRCLHELLAALSDNDLSAMVV